MAIGMYEPGATLDCPARSAEAPFDTFLAATQELLDILPGAVCLCDAEGRVARHNRRAADFWQSPAAPDQAEHAPCLSACLFLPDGAPVPPEAAPLALALKHGLSTRERVFLVECPDGTRRPARLSATPIHGSGGHIVGAMVCAEEIPPPLPPDPSVPEAVPEAGQRLAATYEHAGIGIGETDARGRLLRVNEAYCAITGYSRQELLGMTFSDLALEDDRAGELVLYAEQTAGLRNSYTIEKRQVRKDGAPQWVAITSSAVHGADGAFLYSVRTLQDISTHKRKQERQQMLMGELNHRIKNTLVTVQSLARQTARKTPDAASFCEKFQGRLMALGKAHSLLTRDQWSGAALRDIIEEQVQPYREDEGRRIILTGEAVALTADQAVVLGMVFHELVTNAIKHGSLSWPSGRVRVNWQVAASAPDTGPPVLNLLWQESGGPPARTPRALGFGSAFIERSIRDQLGGSVHMAYLTTGLNCRLEIPLGPGSETGERTA